MTQRKSNVRRTALPAAVLAAIALVLSVGSSTASPTPDVAARGDEASDPRLVPIDARFRGLTYGEWVAQWNQWYYQTVLLPNTPFFDPTGADFATGQSGPVWFLPWAGFRVVDRGITIPAGSSLLFPIHSLDALFQLPVDATEEQIADMGQALFEDTATHIANVLIVIDGVRVQDPWRYQVVSPRFEVDLPGPAFNWFGAPAGHYGPDIAEGLFYLVKPLSAGQHTVHYSMDFVDAPPFTGPYDVTFHVTVVPHSEL